MKTIKKLLFISISSIIVFAFTLIPLVNSATSEKLSLVQNYKDIHSIASETYVLTQEFLSNNVTAQYVKLSSENLMQQTSDIYNSFTSTSIQPTDVDETKYLLQLDSELLINLNILSQSDSKTNIQNVQKNVKKIMILSSEKIKFFK